MRRGGGSVVAALFALAALLLAACAAHRPFGHFRDRAETIASLIDKAEQMGARECSPRELAHAKVRLDHAIHEMLEGHYPASWTEKDFDEAEALAQSLVERRVLALGAGTPLHCVGPEG